MSNFVNNNNSSESLKLSQLQKKNNGSIATMSLPTNNTETSLLTNASNGTNTDAADNNLVTVPKRMTNGGDSTEPRAASQNGAHTNLEDIVPEVVIASGGKRSNKKKSKQREPMSINASRATANGSGNNYDGSNVVDAVDEQELEQEEDELVLKYGASHVIKLFIPVTLCMFFVIVSLTLITSYTKSDGAHLIYTPFNDDNPSASTGTRLWMSIANASIFIGVVVIMTIILVLLYKYSCYKIIHGWLALSSLLLLFLFTYMYISELFKAFNIVVDLITVSFLLWNFGILGMACIHWKGPLILQQIFLIFSCVQMALVFIKYLAEWTTWVLLAFISIWDLIAVLCPFGPLQILVETAKSRNDTLFPAMVYSSTIMYSIATMTKLGKDAVTPKKNSGEQTNGSSEQENDALDATPTRVYTSNENGTRQGKAAAASSEDDDGGFADANKYIPANFKRGPENRREGGVDSPTNVRHRHHGHQQQHPTTVEQHQQRIRRLSDLQQEEEENGVKLGLGDFIFYSILVGKASILGDWNTVIACFVAILIGLCFTLVLLAIFHKALPALPISLFFGLIFYFSTNLLVRPFYDRLTFQQVFI